MYRPFSPVPPTYLSHLHLHGPLLATSIPHRSYYYDSPYLLIDYPYQYFYLYQSFVGDLFTKCGTWSFCNRRDGRGFLASPTKFHLKVAIYGLKKDPSEEKTNPLTQEELDPQLFLDPVDFIPKKDEIVYFTVRNFILKHRERQQRQEEERRIQQQKPTRTLSPMTANANESENPPDSSPLLSSLAEGIMKLNEENTPPSIDKDDDEGDDGDSDPSPYMSFTPSFPSPAVDVASLRRFLLNYLYADIPSVPSFERIAQIRITMKQLQGGEDKIEKSLHDDRMNYLTRPHVITLPWRVHSLMSKSLEDRVTRLLDVRGDHTQSINPVVWPYIFSLYHLAGFHWNGIVNLRGRLARESLTRSTNKMEADGEKIREAFLVNRCSIPALAWLYNVPDYFIGLEILRPFLSGYPERESVLFTLFTTLPSDCDEKVRALIGWFKLRRSPHPYEVYYKSLAIYRKYADDFISYQYLHWKVQYRKFFLRLGASLSFNGANSRYPLKLFGYSYKSRADPRLYYYHDKPHEGKMAPWGWRFGRLNLSCWDFFTALGEYDTGILALSPNESSLNHFRFFHSITDFGIEAIQNFPISLFRTGALERVADPNQVILVPPSFQGKSSLLLIQIVRKAWEHWKFRWQGTETLRGSHYKSLDVLYSFITKQENVSLFSVTPNETVGKPPFVTLKCQDLYQSWAVETAHSVREFLECLQMFPFLELVDFPPLEIPMDNTTSLAAFSSGNMKHAATRYYALQQLIIDPTPLLSSFSSPSSPPFLVRLSTLSETNSHLNFLMNEIPLIKRRYREEPSFLLNGMQSLHLSIVSQNKKKIVDSSFPSLLLSLQSVFPSLSVFLDFLVKYRFLERSLADWKEDPFDVCQIGFSSEWHRVGAVIQQEMAEIVLKMSEKVGEILAIATAKMDPTKPFCTILSQIQGILQAKGNVSYDSISSLFGDFLIVEEEYCGFSVNFFAFPPFPQSSPLPPLFFLLALSEAPVVSGTSIGPNPFVFTSIPPPPTPSPLLASTTLLKKLLAKGQQAKEQKEIPAGPVSFSSLVSWASFSSSTTSNPSTLFLVQRSPAPYRISRLNALSPSSWMKWMEFQIEMPPEAQKLSLILESMKAIALKKFHEMGIQTQYIPARPPPQATKNINEFHFRLFNQLVPQVASPYLDIQSLFRLLRSVPSASHLSDHTLWTFLIMDESLFIEWGTLKRGTLFPHQNLHNLFLHARMSSNHQTCRGATEQDQQDSKAAKTEISRKFNEIKGDLTKYIKGNSLLPTPKWLNDREMEGVSFRWGSISFADASPPFVRFLFTLMGIQLFSVRGGPSWKVNQLGEWRGDANIMARPYKQVEHQNGKGEEEDGADPIDPVNESGREEEHGDGDDNDTVNRASISPRRLAPEFSFQPNSAFARNTVNRYQGVDVGPSSHKRALQTDQGRGFELVIEEFLHSLGVRYITEEFIRQLDVNQQLLGPLSFPDIFLLDDVTFSVRGWSHNDVTRTMGDLFDMLRINDDKGDPTARDRLEPEEKETFEFKANWIECKNTYGALLENEPVTIRFCNQIRRLYKSFGPGIILYSNLCNAELVDILMPDLVGKVLAIPVDKVLDRNRFFSAVMGRPQVFHPISALHGAVKEYYLIEGKRDVIQLPSTIHALTCMANLKYPSKQFESFPEEDRAHIRRLFGNTVMSREQIMKKFIWKHNRHPSLRVYGENKSGYQWGSQQGTQDETEEGNDEDGENEVGKTKEKFQGDEDFPHETEPEEGGKSHADSPAPPHISDRLPRSSYYFELERVFQTVKPRFDTTRKPLEVWKR